jgi:septum formation protein
MCSNHKKLLYLASSSQSRYDLLVSAGFDVHVLKQTYDEARCDWSLPLEKLVESIATAKMEHVLLPDCGDDEIFVITADTLCSDLAGTIYGKPRNREEAWKMIRALRESCRIATAFCLEKKYHIDGAWTTTGRITRVVVGYCICNLPDEWIEDYLEKTGVLNAAGALAIDGYGALFLKTVIGSYSGIIGLPLAELREALAELGFFH